MKKIISAAFFLFISTSLWASSLSISKDFEFIALNGQSVKNAIFSKTTRLTFSSGSQKIAVLYKAAVRDDIGNGSTRVASQPLIISLVAQENEHYKIMSVTKIKHLSDAKAFIKNPQIKVLNSQGNLADYTMRQAKTDDRGVLGNIIKKKEANQQTIAVLETVADADKKGTKSQAEKMLHQWWNKADSETKKQFVSWAIKQIN